MVTDLLVVILVARKFLVQQLQPPCDQISHKEVAADNLHDSFKYLMFAKQFI